MEKYIMPLAIILGLVLVVTLVIGYKEQKQMYEECMKRRNDRELCYGTYMKRSGSDTYIITK